MSIEEVLRARIDSAGLDAMSLPAVRNPVHLEPASVIPQNLEWGEGSAEVGERDYAVIALFSVE